VPNPIADTHLTDILKAGLPTSPEPPQAYGSSDPRYLREAIVVRGYLANPNLKTSDSQVWRIYLSVRLDVYIDFVATDAVRIAQHIPGTPDELTVGTQTPPQLQLVTLWLSRTPSAKAPIVSGASVRIVPRRYFIAKELRATTGFVSAALLEDLMGPGQSSPAWPEQGYDGQGWPTTHSIGSTCHH
jgi:hypothetical protein